MTPADAALAAKLREALHADANISGVDPWGLAAVARECCPALLRMLDARDAALRYAEEQTRLALGCEEVNARLVAALGASHDR